METVSFKTIRLMRIFSLFFIYIIAPLFLFSCDSIIQDPLTNFTAQQTERIKPSKLIELEDYGVLRPNEALKYGDGYIIYDRKREDVVTYVNFSTGKYVSGVNFGNGPNELIMFNGLKIINDKPHIYDMSHKRIFEIIIVQDSLLQIEPYRDINYNKRLLLIELHGNNIIASGLFGDCWIGYVDILNGDLLSGIDFPTFENTNQLQKIQKSIVYASSHIAISPDSKKFVVATQTAGVISFSNIDVTYITEYKQLKYFPPDFSVVQGGNIVYSKKGKSGFCGVECDDDFIYALYSGRTFNSHGETVNYCEHLLVYDWEGNPIKRYILDIPMWSMKYDREKNSIYGTAYNPEGLFIEYQL